jgi:hypothetical protein
MKCSMCCADLEQTYLLVCMSLLPPPQVPGLPRGSVKEVAKPQGAGAASTRGSAHTTIYSDMQASPQTAFMLPPAQEEVG